MAALEAKFANAFDWAVVRLATFLPASASQARLLFGVVSLLTRDRPRPVTGRKIDSHALKGRNGKIFFKRTVLNASDAVDWYRGAGLNGINTPVPADPTKIEPKEDGIGLSPTFFEDDPPWPCLGVPLGTDLFSNAGGPGDPAPFRGAGTPRIHRRFGDSTGFDAVINDDSAVRFLKRRLHFDLSDYIEYLGGLTLVVPDPTLRSVRHFLVPSEDSAAQEHLVYRLVPRPGQNFDGLQLTILERRANLLSRFQTIDIPADGLVTVNSSLPFHETGYAISHPEQGVIAYQQPLSFIRTVGISIRTVGRKVKIQAPRTESSRSPVDHYEIAEYTHESPITVGEERRGSTVKVAEAEQRRNRRAAAKRYKQTWFDDGQRKEAISFLRAQIGRATASVMVADPYFGERQIIQFLHAVPSTQIDFTILTSRLAFEGEHADRIDAAQESDHDQVENSAPITTVPGRLESFTQSLSTLRARGMKSVKTLVLRGKSPSLHDRFLIIDDEVLFLGNSLNALGGRASLILSVPDSEPILAKLQSMANSAMTFDTYASRHGVALGPPSGEA